MTLNLNFSVFSVLGTFFPKINEINDDATVDVGDGHSEH